MQKRILRYSDELRNSLLSGVSKLSGAVKITMGPRGQNVLIELENAPPILTKDGVTVAEAINLIDRFENLGAQVVKEAARQTAEVAGDGTTTSTVLAQAIFEQGTKYLGTGGNIRDLRESLLEAKTASVEHLKDMSIDIRNEKDLKNVATISANGEEDLGEIISEAVNQVGSHGYVSVENSKGYNTELILVDGYQIDRGYISPYFVTNQSKQTVEFKNPLIMLTNQNITHMKGIISILEESVKENRPLVIIANDVTGEALQGLILNKSKGNLKCCVLRAPEFGVAREQSLEDLAAVLGAELIHDSPDSWPNMPVFSMLGSCKNFKAYKEKSVFVDCNSNEEIVNQRIASITLRCEEPNVSLDERNVLDRRRKRMTSGVAVIYVGGSTESEVNERRDRVDDAVNATRVALEDGIIPGGGTAFFRISEKLSENKDIGYQILSYSLKMPLYQISKNAGDVPEVILEKLKSTKGNTGYDASTGKISNIMKDGIIDPVKVAICALENATSAALNLLSVGCAAVIENSENNSEK
jgi:chaperonin GroEL